MDFNEGDWWVRTYLQFRRRTRRARNTAQRASANGGCVMGTEEVCRGCVASHSNHETTQECPHHIAVVANAMLLLLETGGGRQAALCVRSLPRRRRRRPQEKHEARARRWDERRGTWGFARTRSWHFFEPAFPNVSAGGGARCPSMHTRACTDTVTPRGGQRGASLARASGAAAPTAAKPGLLS